MQNNFREFYKKKMNFVLLKGVNVMFNDKKFNLLVVEIVYIILCY